MPVLAPSLAVSRPLTPDRAGWRRWVAFDHCRVVLPQFTFARRTDRLARLHQLSVDDESSAPPAPGPAGRLAVRLVFAGVVLRQMLIFFRRYSGYARTHDGVSRWRQWRDLWHCAWRQNRSPRHYYWRKLYLLPGRAQWLENLEHRQLTALLRHLHRDLPLTRVTDKFNFHRHCREHGLPTPDLLGAWDGEGRPRMPAADAPLAADLFLKPPLEFGSRGARVLPWDAATGTHRLEDRALDWPALLDGLSQLAQSSRGLLAQPRLRNAPRNALYGNFDLCNLRIVTGRLPDGEPEAIGSFIRLPSRFTTAGADRRILFAHVDVRTGRMATGQLREIAWGEFDLHPETRAPIAGRAIPGWGDMLALALDAHRTMPWLPFVGWDVVDTEQGLMLLEANAYWGGDAMQAPGAVPLGRTRFPEIYLAWFDRLDRPRPRNRERLAA